VPNSRETEVEGDRNPNRLICGSYPKGLGYPSNPIRGVRSTNSSMKYGLEDKPLDFMSNVARRSARSGDG